jgi:hypothetical protein
MQSQNAVEPMPELPAALSICSRDYRISLLQGIQKPSASMARASNNMVTARFCVQLDLRPRIRFPARLLRDAEIFKEHAGAGLL